MQKALGLLCCCRPADRKLPCAVHKADSVGKHMLGVAIGSSDAVADMHSCLQCVHLHLQAVEILEGLLDRLRSLVYMHLGQWSMCSHSSRHVRDCDESPYLMKQDEASVAERVLTCETIHRHAWLASWVQKHLLNLSCLELLRRRWNRHQLLRSVLDSCFCKAVSRET